MARTITVDTGEELKRFIDESVNSGNYKTTSEVVRDGLRLLQEREASSRLEILRKLLKEGEDSGIAKEWNLNKFLADMDAQHDENKT